MSQRRVLYVRLDEDRERDIIEWLEGLPSRPTGLKGQAIKEALRRGIRGDDASSSSASATVTLDADAVREAVSTAITHSLDLTQIRRVVEAAGGSARATARVSGVEEGGDEDEDDSEAFLDTLGDELLM